MIIGVTGKYCAGKNTVTRVFEDRGYRVVDVDKLGHEALEVNQKEIAGRFGPGILEPDGRINRRKLGDRVFGNPSELQALEAIVHPWMKEQVKKEVGHSGGKRNIVINAALLFYLELHFLCDAVIWVKSSGIQRFIRAVRRDNLSWMAVIKRFCAQTKLSAQSTENHVDIYYIDNSRTRESVTRQIDRVLARLK